MDRGTGMRSLILTIFLVAVVAFVLTDPRWTGRLATPISVPWESGGLMTPAGYGTSEVPRTTRLGPEERCAYAGRWLGERQERGTLMRQSELAAFERVMEGCRR